MRCARSTSSAVQVLLGAVQELNHLADTSCVLFVRAFVNVEKANVVPAGKRLTVKQFTLLRQVPYILLELVVRCLKR